MMDDDELRRKGLALNDGGQMNALIREILDIIGGNQASKGIPEGPYDEPTVFIPEILSYSPQSGKTELKKTDHSGYTRPPINVVGF